MNDLLEEFLAGLSKERTVQIALVCAFFVFLPKIVALLFVIVKLLPCEITKYFFPELIDVSSYLINSIADFISAFANAFAVFVTVLGILSIKESLDKEAIKREVKKTEEPAETIQVRQTIDQVTPLKDVFIDAAKEDSKIMNETIDCLERYGIDSNGLNRENLPFEQFYDALQDRLINCKAVIVLCYTPPNSWIRERLRLYTRLGIMSKVIVTGKTPSEINSLLMGMRKQPIVVPFEISEKSNCDELAMNVRKLEHI